MTRFLRGERLDRLMAAALLVLGQVELWLGKVPIPKPLAVLVAVAMTGSIALRRRWPLAVGVVVLLGNAVDIISGGPGKSVALLVGYMCALYGVAVWTETRGFLAGLGALAGSNVASYLIGSDHSRTALQYTVLFTVIPGFAMLLVRSIVRNRDLRAETLAARADLLERERELRAHEAVAQERSRIARELHDLVAHNVSVMVVQAGAERHALAEDQASTREVLSSIEQAGRQALAEARRLLGMLRRNGDERGELEPQPSIDQLDFLAEQVGRAGLPVKLEIEGERVPLPAGLDLCVYRVVQEGLTNALKHAGPACAEVRLRYSPRSVDVEVRDDGSGVTQGGANGPGHGLLGMRERVALYGGELTAGPRNGGGFEIRVQLPLA